MCMGLSESYPQIKMTNSNHGWHANSFYIWNHDGSKLPDFTSAPPVEKVTWKWGCPTKGKKKVDAIVGVVEKLVKGGVIEISVF